MSSEYLESLFGLSGQTAVVIGGAGVLGGAVLRRLARRGQADCRRHVERHCKARVAELKKLGGKVDYCLVDVTSRNSSKTCWQRLSTWPAGRTSW